MKHHANQAKPGHLATHGLMLKQTEQAKQRFGQRTRGNAMLRSVKVVLDWKAPK
jgi:hypothetical protein